LDALKVPDQTPVEMFELLTGRQAGSGVEKAPVAETGPEIGNDPPKHSFPETSAIVEEKLFWLSMVPVQVPEHVPGAAPVL